MISILAAGFFLSAFILLGGCNDAGAETSVNEGISTSEKPDPVKRGEYLVTVLGCDDCHSEKIFTDQGPIPDPDRRLSGYPADKPLPDINPTVLGPDKWMLMNASLTATVGPWGVSFAGNLTPDPTGIGNWTEEQFMRALREGKFKGLENGRPLLPPMPWPGYRHLTDEDILAIFAYLKTLKPVRNIVPAPIPPNQMVKEG